MGSRNSSPGRLLRASSSPVLPAEAHVATHGQPITRSLGIRRGPRTPDSGLGKELGHSVPFDGYCN